MSTPSKKQKSKAGVALAAAAGASMEWYDFFIYGIAAALIFPKLFFPDTLSPFVAQLAAFSTFAVGFLARPVGGALFGHFGDKFGRKTTLVVALVLMGVSTTLVGLLPPYAVIGDLAPLALVVLRFLQGFAVGGQWGGAALLAIESAPSGKRGFYGSFAQIGVPVGLVLANAAFYLVSAKVAPEAFESWGWRLPFLFSVVIVGVGMYVQFHLEESDEFAEKRGQPDRAVAAKTKSPILSVMMSHPREILLAGGAFLANNICFYVAITYAIAYGTSTLGLPNQVMIASVMVGSVVMVPVLLISGWLSDRWGRLGIFMVGAVLSGLWALVFFPLLETKSPALISLTITVELVLLSLMYGPQAALFAELFPVKVRYSGASLGYQIGAVVGGGFAPIIAVALYEYFQTSLSIALYMSAACAISFICTFLLGRSVSYGELKEARIR